MGRDRRCRADGRGKGEVERRETDSEEGVIAARDARRPGSTGALLQPMLELRSSGTTTGSNVGRMRATARRHEGDVDDWE